MFSGENGTKVHLPGANLNNIANQADDLLEVTCYLVVDCDVSILCKDIR